MGRGPAKPKAEDYTLRIIVENSRPDAAYVRLLDEDWQKENVWVTIGEMEDPTIGKRLSLGEKWKQIVEASPDGRVHVHELYLWSPALCIFAETFVLHRYEQTGKETFEDPEMFYFRFEQEQTRGDVILWHGLNLVLTGKSRIAFTMPAYQKMFLDIAYHL